MNNGNLKKIYYCPIKSLSFNELSLAKIDKNIGIINDRCFAFTRGLNLIQSNEHKNFPKTRNLNNFLTLRNTPSLKKFNFIFDYKEKLKKLYKDNKLILNTNMLNKNDIKNIENFITNTDSKIKKPVFLIHNNKIPFFDTAPNISISMINLNTIKDLEKILNKDIHFERFRANLYIENLKPWEEFNFIDKKLLIGNIKFEVSGKIPRCKITNINPQNYDLDMNIPRELLNNFGHSDFGVYLKPLNSGIIHNNDNLTII